MKQALGSYYGLRTSLNIYAVFVGLSCSAGGYGGERDEAVPNVSKPSGELRTLIPRAAESIVVDGVTYNLEGATRTLLEILSSNNEKRKVRFLAEMKHFGDRLQGDLIPRLKTEIQTQSNPEVRGGILELVMHSRDPNFIAFCELARKDQDPGVRAFAGAMLIENGHIEGFEALTSSLPSLKKHERMNLVPILMQGIDRMQIPFVDSKGTLRAKPQSKEEALAYLDEWSEWWKQHRTEVLKKSKDAAQPGAK